MFQLSSEALAEIRHQVRSSGAAGLALRVAARRDGDGSIQYGMGFDDEKPDDFLLDFDDLKVLIAPASEALLASTELDYVELSPGQFNFIFAPLGQSRDDVSPSGSDCASSRSGSSCGNCGSGGCSSGR